MAVVPKGSDPSGKSWLPSLISGGLSVGGSVLGYLLNRKDSNTAHQREVEDLKKAGISPLMTTQGRGAPVADASEIARGIERGAGSALALRMAKAQISAVEAQASSSEASALLARTQAGDIQTQAASGKYRLLSSQADLADLTVQEKQRLLPLAVERARAEIEQRLSGAAQGRAMAALNKARLKGELNLEQLEKDLGEAGPAARLLLALLRSTR